MYTFNTETYFVVGYRKLQNIIKKEFGKSIDILADQADVIKKKDRVKIIVNGVVRAYDKKRMRIFTERGEYDSLIGTLMNDLAFREIIPLGKYFIQFGGKDVEKELY